MQGMGGGVFLETERWPVVLTYRLNILDCRSRYQRSLLVYVLKIQRMKISCVDFLYPNLRLTVSHCMLFLGIDLVKTRVGLPIPLEMM